MTGRGVRLSYPCVWQPKFGNKGDETSVKRRSGKPRMAAVSGWILRWPVPEDMDSGEIFGIMLL